MRSLKVCWPAPGAKLGACWPLTQVPGCIAPGANCWATAGFDLATIWLIQACASSRVLNLPALTMASSTRGLFMAAVPCGRLPRPGKPNGTPPPYDEGKPGGIAPAPGGGNPGGMATPLPAETPEEAGS